MFAGTWVNDRGSAMILEQHGDRISGRYVTRIGHEDVADKEHSIVGAASGTTIGFVVAWLAAGSVTSWVGRVEVDGDGTHRLHTVWHLVRSASGEPPRALGIWESFLTNSSVFTRSGGET